MPYLLSRPVHPGIPELWREGSPYERTKIYDGCLPQSGAANTPPVRYDAHTLRPHSLTHADAPAHIIPGGKTIDAFFTSDARASPFWGPAVVVKAPLSWFEKRVCRVSLAQLKNLLQATTGSAAPPARLLVSAEGIPTHPDFGHHPDWPLVLEEDAAQWLSGHSDFVMYGTSWKSTDFQPPHSQERPIHRLIFKRGIIFECLDLMPVPSGQYFFVGVPLRLQGASESPACPLLFTKDEIAWSPA